MPEITIYDDIGAGFFDEGITAKSINAQLSEMEGDLTIRINSYGGDVFEGHAIYNLIKNYDGKKTVVVDGIAASAASVIAMAGDEIQMPINSMLMIHDPWTMAIGNSADMKKTAEVLDKIKQTIVNVYVDQTGMKDDVVADMMTEETWLDSDGAQSLGFAVKDEGASVNNKLESKQWINKIPNNIVQINEKQTVEPEKEPEQPARQYPNNDARKRYLELQAEAC